VSLVGLPGSGKSTVGKHLARHLRFGLFDTDHVIEQRIGCSVKQYFEQSGETAFRNLEQQVLAELALRTGVVLSTGGGAVLRDANRMVLKQYSVVVYLHSKPEEIYRRLRFDQTRPLLQVADPMQKLRELYAQRDALYKDVAHIAVETGRPSVSTLVHQILSELKRSGLPAAQSWMPKPFLAAT
jgi:shikimate kinase